MAAVRYIVSDIASCVDFYRDQLGFAVDMQSAGFAGLSRGDLRLYLNISGAGSAGKAGGRPEPGGWNRFQIETDDLDSMLKPLRAAAASFRGDIASGAGGRQILIEDPSGNVVELFEPKAR